MNCWGAIAVRCRSDRPLDAGFELAIAVSNLCPVGEKLASDGNASLSHRIVNRQLKIATGVGGKANRCI
jgi:hypothetical protein